MLIFVNFISKSYKIYINLKNFMNLSSKSDGLTDVLTY